MIAGVRGPDHSAHGVGEMPRVTSGFPGGPFDDAALVHLAAFPIRKPGGQEQRDLATAQQLIDILGMLGKKTRGNLEHDERPCSTRFSLTSE